MSTVNVRTMPRALPTRQFLLSCIGWFVSALLFVYFSIQLDWTPIEWARFIGGIALLWGPFAGVLFLLISKYLPSLSLSIFVSFGASYALTTTLYFLCSIAKIEFAFYILQLAAILLAIYRLIQIRKKLSSFSPSSLKPDLLLVLLLAVSQVTNLPYMKGYIVDPITGNRTFQLLEDQLYHTGLAYELARGVPPQQAVQRAGFPERAYHYFSHLTTVLIGRYSNQGDLLRAQLVYHYTVLQLLMCLMLYSIGRVITGSKWFGYVLPALMYPLSLPWPPLLNTPLLQSKKLFNLYFTVFPQNSSGLEVLAIGSPQMYSGVLVFYIWLFLVLVISRRVVERKPVDALIWISTLIIASTLRFRIHIFLVGFPVWNLFLLWLIYRDRKLSYLLPLFVGIALSGVLYFEMFSPSYLQDTAAVSLGYNALSEKSPLFLEWPFAIQVRSLLSAWFTNPEVFKWAWQIVSMIGFTVLNIVGIPLFLATLIAIWRIKRNREIQIAVWMMIGMVIFSLLAAIFLTLQYEPWSLSGQALLQTRWYIFPLLGWVCWRLYHLMQARLLWSKQVWIILGIVLVILGALIRQFGPESRLHQSIRMYGGYNIPKPALTPAEWETMLFLRESTPQDAVLLVNQYIDSYQWVFSANTGRRVFLEGAGGIVDKQTLKIFPNDDRREMINQIWAESNSTNFCKLVTATPATILVEYKRSPLAASESPCLTLIGTSSNNEIVLWQIMRDENN